MNGTLASSSFTVNGVHGFLLIVAVIVFFIAACAAFFAPAHRAVHTLIAAGLCLATAALLWT
jgi:hypothetical protein